MMIKRFASLLLMVLLAGCSSQQEAPVQKAQNSRPGPERSLNMEQLCKEQAAHRYNTGAQKIDVTGFERFQGGYEMQGFTTRKESFVCSFDAEGQFLHLSMR